NPVGGGRLTGGNPVLGRLAAQVGAVSVADLALRYVLSNPYVTAVVSGIAKDGDCSTTRDPI
ncbi:MAG: hypothetical protein R6X03_10290, partial [Methyloceanibacter sp.]